MQKWKVLIKILKKQKFLWGWNLPTAAALINVKENMPVTDGKA